jgi:L-threonylcarbamoyladenylate synthase
MNMVHRIFKLYQNTQYQPEIESLTHQAVLESINTLKKGGIIVFPTETIYGLGVDINNDSALERLVELKGRPKNMPISIAVIDFSQITRYAEISSLAKKIINQCLPKPITILLKAKGDLNKKLTGGSELIGFRFPDNQLTREIIKSFGPITATSANLHGTPEPVTIDSAIGQFGDQVGVYIDTGPCKFAAPSTVIDATGDTIKIIRHGACSGREIEECIQDS